MVCYKATPISRREIRNKVSKIKSEVGLSNTYPFPVLRFLEIILPVYCPGFQINVLTKHEMGDKHGETFPSQKLICIREDIYNRASDGRGRDLFTIGHEIGHLFLHEEKRISKSHNENLKTYEDPEWQASAFAGELLAPSHRIGGMTVEEVVKKFGVSRDAAKFQLRVANKEAQSECASRINTNKKTPKNC